MRKSGTISLLVAALATGVALGHEGAMGTIADRMKVMKQMAESMKTIGEMLNGREPFDAKIVQASIATLHNNCHQAQGQFSQGTADHASRASPAVWEKPKEFQAEMERFDAAVKALVARSEAGNADVLRIPFNAVGQSCSSCHERFRLTE